MFAFVWNWCLARVSPNLNCGHRSMEEEAIVSAAFLPDELIVQIIPRLLPNEFIVEIISRLPVKYLIQFRCVSKFYETLISALHFIQMHLNKSARNTHLLPMKQADPNCKDCKDENFAVSSLLQNKHK